MSIPFSKLLLSRVAQAMMAELLYLGANLGLAIMVAATVLMVNDTITLQHTHKAVQ